MKRIALALILALTALSGAQAQITHGRIVTDRISNTAVLTMSGTTPDVSTGNTFKTNNGSPTSVTNFLGGVTSQVISVTCGDTNTTFVNGSNIVTAFNLNIVCLSVG